MAHTIRFHPQREIQSGSGNRLIVIRSIRVGRAVHVGRADFLERPEKFVVVVLRAVEHQVLEQMREARLARILILRADVVPDVGRDNRRLAIFVDDDAQAIVQCEFLKGDNQIFIRREAGDGDCECA